MANEKRNIRNYKITDAQYFRAMKVAGKRKEKLSQLVEGFVIAYSKGTKIHIIESNTLKSTL